MRLMMLGASTAQLQGILEAKKLGNDVVTCDYIPQAIGHGYSDAQCYTSTFDVEGICNAAKAYGVDGLMTMGTDQPVYGVAVASERMGIPSMLTPQVALSVTHKKVMKEKFLALGLPTVPYRILSKEAGLDGLEGLDFPVVIKPVDSQGQRGIFFCKSEWEVLAAFDKVLAYSREAYILVEAYYPHEEVTVSGWVEEGRVTILSMTDRVTFDDHNQIGICLGHTFPTKHKEDYGSELEWLSNKIVDGFGIEHGPIYFQMLIGQEGIKINEIACRIGGAYESVYLPVVTGFDLCKAMVTKTMNQAPDISPLKTYDFMSCEDHLSVQLFFSEACRVAEIPDVAVIKGLEGVIDYQMHYGVGDEIGLIENATARAGYVIVRGPSRESLIKRLDQVYEALVIIGCDGHNHLIHEAYKK